MAPLILDLSGHMYVLTAVPPVLTKRKTGWSLGSGWTLGHPLPTMKPGTLGRPG
jgi:hypothetical protein